MNEEEFTTRADRILKFNREVLENHPELKTLIEEALSTIEELSSKVDELETENEIITDRELKMLRAMDPFIKAAAYIDGFTPGLPRTPDNKGFITYATKDGEFHSLRAKDFREITRMVEENFSTAGKKDG